jgi:hypothetical protein
MLNTYAMVIRMSRKSEAVHDNHLERVINQIMKSQNVGSRKLLWVMKDGLWLSEYQERMMMPDIIACYRDNSFLLGELKSDSRHRDKALEQLYSGERFVKEHFEPISISKQIIYYRGGEYKFEVI